MTTLLKSSLNGLSGSASAVVLDGARRATGETAAGGLLPDPEVVATARRRQFSAADKRRILAEAHRCTEPGQIGALLRREGIYSSMLATWRKQVSAAGRAALAPQKRGPKPDAAARQIKHLNRDNARLRRRLERAELIIDAQKKLCVALGLPTADETGASE